MQTHHNPPRRAEPWATVQAASLAACCLLSAGCAHEAHQPIDLSFVSDSQPSPALTAEQERQVGAFCGDCHALPRPESFPQDRWHFEIKKGYELYAKSGRSDLAPPPLHVVLAYYRARAPRELAKPINKDAPGPSPFAPKLATKRPSPVKTTMRCACESEM